MCFMITLMTMMMMITPSEALIQQSAGSLATTPLPDHDLLSLLALKDQLVGAPGDGGSSNILSSWNINQSSHLHFCQWPGVVCGRRHKKRVVGLYLPNAGLAGTISPDIANLSFLSYIEFGNNSLHGQIPAEMGRLHRLKFLSLPNNSLTGEIPANLSYCSKLEFITLSGNQLEGNIPFQLGYLPNLRKLALALNKLTGSIPASLGNLTNLAFLYLSQNSLSGSIPKELGRLSRLEFLLLSLNPLSGRIPPSLFNLSSLTHLELLMNNLHGNLPPALGGLKLRHFLVAGNFLTGPIPSSLSNLSSLKNFNLGENSFTGPIPSNLGRLQSLQNFEVFQNKLQAKDEDLSFLTQLITNCSLLEILAVGDNRLTGWLPPESDLLTNFSSNLRNLDLGDNPIRGNLPKWILNLENLEVLYLPSMNLTGEMPSEFGKLTKLKYLNLAQNRFAGVIPPSIGNITGLNYLYLSENGLKGRIPSSVGNFRELLELDLSHNALTGPLPEQVFNISSLSIVLDLSNNALSGTIPMEVGNLQNLGMMDISHNQLSGEIPSTLSNCLGLEYLNISGNFLNGTIPASLRNLKGIVTLGLDRNNLSGEIPDYLGDFAFLSYLNLSFNNLQGQVPENGIFKNASAFSVVGNGKLCGGIKELQLPPCSSTTHPLNKKSSGINLHHLKKILIVTSVILSLVLSIFLMFLCWRRRTSRRKSGIPSSYKDHDYDLLIRSVGYKELLNATNGFSPSNLIGRGSFGSVYRGVLLDHHQNDDNDNDEEEERRVVINVAVKVLNLQNRGASKSFMAECEALRSIRHRNLVKIITACSSIDYKGNDFKALVFAYLPNGSLETWLHPKQYYVDGPTSSDHQILTSKLTLKERLNIAIDVASALEYLHHHCETPIVHRDLKPSNVLLDEDMNAYVGDFGIAKVQLSATSRSKTTTSIKGTIGYIAPEYGLDEKVSTQGDVYSYGVLLLEVFTGKRPTDEMFSDALSLHQFVKDALLEHQYCLEKIVDPRLLLHPSSSIGESSSSAASNTISRRTPNDNSRYNTESCLLSVLRIGVHCSEDLPNKRMEMNHVVSQMHSIRDEYLIGTADLKNRQM